MTWLPKKLSAKLLLAILPPVCLAVCSIVWLQHNAARAEILGAIKKEIGLLAARTADNIDEQLDQRQRELFTVSDSPLIGDYYRNVDFKLLDEAEAYRRELQRSLAQFAQRSG